MGCSSMRKKWQQVSLTRTRTNAEQRFKMEMEEMLKSFLLTSWEIKAPSLVAENMFYVLFKNLTKAGSRRNRGAELSPEMSRTPD